MLDGGQTVELLICTKCRGLGPPSDEGERPGTILHRRLSQEDLPGVQVTPVECLQNCERGCTIALRGAGRWTYVYGACDETGDLDQIREGAARYRDTADGLIPWRERPLHFRKNCVARIPPIAGDPS